MLRKVLALLKNIIFFCASQKIVEIGSDGFATLENTTVSPRKCEKFFQYMALFF